MNEKKSIVKKRHWAFVVYPESVPEGWRDILQHTGASCAISPIHDMDINPDGSNKKPHWHIIISYSGPTTFKNVEKLTNTLNSPIPQPLEQINGYYRYLTHKDNPEKAQYKESEITLINGFTIRDFVELKNSELLAIKIEITKYIEENDILEYRDLLSQFVENNKIDMYDTASKHTILFNAYIKSRRHKLEKIARDEECSKNQLQAPPGHNK
jgi:hypothetical protein